MKNLTQLKFGKLLVLHKVESTSKYTRWLCQCDCGTYKEIEGYQLSNNRIKSCGCSKKGKVPINLLPPGEASFNKLWCDYLYMARKRNLEWQLTKEQVAAITKKNCAYCNSVPSGIKHHSGYNSSYIYTMV